MQKNIKIEFLFFTHTSFHFLEKQIWICWQELYYAQLILKASGAIKTPNQSSTERCYEIELLAKCSNNGVWFKFNQNKNKKNYLPCQKLLFIWQIPQ